MASACVNSIGVSPESFLDCPTAKFQPYGWLSPRISLSREFPDEAVSKGSANKLSSKNQAMAANADGRKLGEPDPGPPSKDFVDFEFRLEDPVRMLPADELFVNGKLVPLKLAAIRHSMTFTPAFSDVRSSDTPKSRRRNELTSVDPYLFSPKAPRCSSRWKDLLGLRKLYQNSNAKNEDESKDAARGLKHFFHRNSKSSLTIPLLKDSDNESMSISARLSLSSSSSGHEHDDLPRLSLDSNKQSNISRNIHQTTNNLSRVRVVKHRTASSSEKPTARVPVGRSPIIEVPESAVPVRVVSIDSPRMNSSGKIVFNSLERSSSSPSTFNVGPRHKHRGMERSYSASVRVTPVLNVPVCSIRGSSKSGVFGLFSSQQKKESGGGVVGNRKQHSHCRNRTDRT